MWRFGGREHHTHIHSGFIHIFHMPLGDVSFCHEYPRQAQGINCKLTHTTQMNDVCTWLVPIGRCENMNRVCVFCVSFPLKLASDVPAKKYFPFSKSCLYSWVMRYLNYVQITHRMLHIRSHPQVIRLFTNAMRLYVLSYQSSCLAMHISNVKYNISFDIWYLPKMCVRLEFNLIAINICCSLKLDVLM